MELLYSLRTLYRMLTRDITDRQIRAVLDNPQWMPPTTRNTRYDGMVDERRLAVPVAGGTDPLIVVTRVLGG